MDQPKSPAVTIDRLDVLWFQIAGTKCNLTCNHCFISCSPKNNNFGFLARETVREYLEQAKEEGVREFYFTGGEPFLNPEMTEILIDTLATGPATVLTNATVLKESWLAKLSAAVFESKYSLEFRVSIDGFDSFTNDPIRGEGTFDRAIAGVQKLVEYGFLPIITAVQTWDDSESHVVLEKFQQKLKSIGYQRPRIKILPTLQIGAEENRTCGYSETQRVTDSMMEGFDQSQLVCSNSRIVTDRGVHVCPILIEAPDSQLSDRLSEAQVPFELNHGACYTCYQFGSICSNSTAQTRSSIEPWKES